MLPAIVITARLGSERLPRKVLTPLCGRPALERLVTRLGRAQLPDLMVLATTSLTEDDELAAIGAELGVKVVRGDPDDILARWLQGAEALGIDLLVTCDGDDVFCDPDYVDRVIQCHIETGADYISCVGLPFGTAPMGISRAGLTRVCAAKRVTSTEGQGRFFEDPRLVSRAQVNADPDVRHGAARLTLDLPDDARTMEAIIAELEHEDDPDGFSLADIVELLNARPDIVAINSHLQEAYMRRFRERYPSVSFTP
jgi:spore coat polysaccharide biosynthesis protein SpsF